MESDDTDTRPQYPSTCSAELERLAWECSSFRTSMRSLAKESGRKPIQMELEDSKFEG